MNQSHLVADVRPDTVLFLKPIHKGASESGELLTVQQKSPRTAGMRGQSLESSGVYHCANIIPNNEYFSILMHKSLYDNTLTHKEIVALYICYSLAELEAGKGRLC